MEHVAWAAAAVVLIALVFWRSAKAREEQVRQREQVWRLLDRFGTLDEALAFLRSPEGRALLEGRSVDNPAVSLRQIQAGAFAVVIAVALFANGIRMSGDPDINAVRAVEDHQYWGTVFLVVGFGLFAIAAITRWLSRRWDPRSRGGAA